MKPSVIVWDLETVRDLGGFAAVNDLVGAFGGKVDIRSDSWTIAICEYMA
jgi:hypothetical protein